MSSDYFAVRKKERGIMSLFDKRDYLPAHKVNFSFHQRILDINERSKQVIGEDEVIELNLPLR